MRVRSALVLAAILAGAGCAHQPPDGFDRARAANASCRQLLPSDAPRPLWISPADLDSRVRLASWCATVGPVYFKPTPAPNGTPIAGTVAIVSWNIHEGRGDVGDLIRRLRAGEFTGGEPIGHFVLLLQEATRRDDAVPRRVPRGSPSPRRIAGPSASDRDVRRFAEEGFAVLYAPSMRNGEQAGAGEDRGNAIVSTLPMAQPQVIELPLERQRRVAVAVSIAGPAGSGERGRLNVIDVHLDTALALFHGGPLAARERQTIALLEALRPTLDAAGTIVLAGDLNAWVGDREPAVRLLQRAFADIVTDRRRTWVGPLGLHARVDHIFVRGARAPSPGIRLPSRFGSDHYPLLTLFRF